jgi:hypothetical protein
MRKERPGVSSIEISHDELRSAQGRGTFVPRAHRWPARDMLWLSTVRLSSGPAVQLLNISSSGLLVESDSALMPGSSPTFELCFPDKVLIAPAHIVRSEVSKISPGGFRYRVAARLHQELQLPASCPLVPVMDLRGLEAQVEVKAGDDAGDVAPRAAFDASPRDLARPHELSVRAVVATENDGIKSVDLRVPTDGGAQAVVQAMSGPNSDPAAQGFDIPSAAVLAVALFREGHAGCDNDW